MYTIINSSRACALNMEHIFTVDDLEYLYRGGRVSRTAAFVGSLESKKMPLTIQQEGSRLENNNNNNNLFQQARNAVMNFMNQQNSASNAQDKQAAQNAIQAAYQDATPEEKQQLHFLLRT